MYKVLVVLVFFTAVYARAPIQTNCDSNNDCSADECCVAYNRFFLASKRAIQSLVNGDKKGVCTKYIAEGQSCHMKGFASCGCAPGLECIYYPPADLTPVINLKSDVVDKRRIIYQPGDSLCEA